MAFNVSTKWKHPDRACLYTANSAVRVFHATNARDCVELDKNNVLPKEYTHQEGYDALYFTMGVTGKEISGVGFCNNTTLRIYSGTKASYLVFRDAECYVNNGGTLSDASFCSGSKLYAREGSSLERITVEDHGMLFICAGASAGVVNVNNGGYCYVERGANVGSIIAQKEGRVLIQEGANIKRIKAPNKNMIGHESIWYASRPAVDAVIGMPEEPAKEEATDVKDEAPEAVKEEPPVEEAKQEEPKEEPAKEETPCVNIHMPPEPVPEMHTQPADDYVEPFIHMEAPAAVPKKRPNLAIRLHNPTKPVVCLDSCGVKEEDRPAFTDKQIEAAIKALPDSIPQKACLYPPEEEVTKLFDPDRIQQMEGEP